MSLVRKMYVLDNIFKLYNFRGKINRVVTETINPERSFWSKQWNSIGVHLCKGIYSNEKNLDSIFSIGIRLLGILNGMHQIIFIIDNVYD